MGGGKEERGKMNMSKKGGERCERKEERKQLSTTAPAHIQDQLPFAVVGSREEIVVGGHKVRARQYPWGTVEGEWKEEEEREREGKEGGEGREGKEGGKRKRGGRYTVFSGPTQFLLLEKIEGYG